MKKVSGCIDVRALGRYDWEFYVEDDATEEEIKKKVDEICDCYIGWEVEAGYVAETRTETIYRKKHSWE